LLGDYTVAMTSSRNPRSSRASSHTFTDSERGTRLQKILAEAGVAARRECEELILGGAVSVNGHIVDMLPAWVDAESDTILVYGKPLKRAEKHFYVMLFKPRGTVCTNSDPEGRPRAIDLVNHPQKPRLYCVGRLDLDTSGLLILTNDGEFANRLTHPRYEVAKGYDVTLDGNLDEARIKKLEREIFAAGRGEKLTTRSSLVLINRDRESTVVHLELAEHRNLQIRPLMLQLGVPVKKLRRTSFGPLKLKGLAVGEWRDLTPREVEQLRKASKHESVGGAMEPRKPRRSMAEAAVVREERAAAREAKPVVNVERAPDSRPYGASTSKHPMTRAAEATGKFAPKTEGRPTGKPTSKSAGKSAGKPFAKPTAKPFTRDAAKPFAKPSAPSSRSSGSSFNRSGAVREGSQRSAAPRSRSSTSSGASRGPSSGASRGPSSGASRGPSSSASRGGSSNTNPRAPRGRSR
jgi:23S rRNA pseudouridine2605 synthase